MKITVLGLNHKTAPVDIREKLAFNSEQVSDALNQMKNKFPNTEFALLSTCNRTEVYFFDRKEADSTNDEISQFLSDFCSIKISLYA